MMWVQRITITSVTVGISVCSAVEYDKIRKMDSERESEEGGS